MLLRECQWVHIQTVKIQIDTYLLHLLSRRFLTLFLLTVVFFFSLFNTAHIPQEGLLTCQVCSFENKARFELSKCKRKTFLFLDLFFFSGNLF